MESQQCQVSSCCHLLLIAFVVILYLEHGTKRRVNFSFSKSWNLEKEFGFEVKRMDSSMYYMGVEHSFDRLTLEWEKRGEIGMADRQTS